MKRTCRSTRKGRQSPRRGCEDPFAKFDPDPVSVRLYRLGQPSHPVFLAMLAWSERSVAHVWTRYGPGVYQIVMRYRGGVTWTRVFEIAGPPLDDTDE